MRFTDTPAIHDSFVTFVILFLILVNAFYVAAEFAAVSVRRNMIREMAENGSRVAVHLLKILENTKELDRYIAACQFGITIPVWFWAHTDRLNWPPICSLCLSGLVGWTP